MSMVEGEPLPGTQNIDGSDKAGFVLSDKPEDNEFPSAEEQADAQANDSDEKADEKSAKAKS